MKPSEFNFRLWVKDKRIYYSAVLEFEKRKMKLIPINDDNVEIELWSGFVDKNNKKIYDGDIVKYRNYDDNLIIIYNGTWHIVYAKLSEDLKFETSLKLQAIANREKSRKLTILEVLGNIHENPELLKDI